MLAARGSDGKFVFRKAENYQRCVNGSPDIRYHIEMDNYRISWKRGNLLTDNDLAACAKLFSGHYGFWGAAANPKIAGRQIKLSPEKLRDYLLAPDSWAALAYFHDELVGYAFSMRFQVVGQGGVTWVTQFVVHKDHRHQGLGTRLLRSIWSQSDQYAWGLVTANPFAVRALEKATLRTCDPTNIRTAWPILHGAAQDFLPYVANAAAALPSSSTALDTAFPLNHEESERALAQLLASGYRWHLGALNINDEWVAFTFVDQEYSEEAARLVEEWIADCDRTVIDAYSGMTLDMNHQWTIHQVHEIDVFIALAQPARGESVLDLGCGSGRHSIELAKRGYCVTGIDFVPQLIAAGQRRIDEEGLLDIATLHCGDARDHTFANQFDYSICLYDVIGSFASDAENARLIENVYRHLKAGGLLLASVMNGELTANKAVNLATSATLKKRLLELPPSNIMQSNGNIFDPNFYVWDSDSGVAYRKEQFHSDNIAPCELVVRDRRYSAAAIADLCSSIGFDVLEIRYVQTGKWDHPLEADDNKAKEILLLCKKPVAEAVG